MPQPLEISTSYPYLSVARAFGLPYGTVLTLADTMMVDQPLSAFPHRAAANHELCSTLIPREQTDFWECMIRIKEFVWDKRSDRDHVDLLERRLPVGGQ